MLNFFSKFQERYRQVKSKWKFGTYICVCLLLSFPHNNSTTLSFVCVQLANNYGTIENKPSVKRTILRTFRSEGIIPRWELNCRSCTHLMKKDLRNHLSLQASQQNGLFPGTVLTGILSDALAIRKSLAVSRSTNVDWWLLSWGWRGPSLPEL